MTAAIRAGHFCAFAAWTMACMLLPRPEINMTIFFIAALYRIGGLSFLANLKIVLDNQIINNYKEIVSRRFQRQILGELHEKPI